MHIAGTLNLIEDKYDDSRYPDLVMSGTSDKNERLCYVILVLKKKKKKKKYEC